MDYHMPLVSYGVATRDVVRVVGVEEEGQEVAHAAEEGDVVAIQVHVDDVDERGLEAVHPLKEFGNQTSP